MTYFKAFPARVPPSIDRSAIDGGDGGGLPLMLKADQPATMTVRVCGLPAPVVRWYVGPALVQTDRTPTTVAQRAASDDEDSGVRAVKHSLTVDSVTDELEQGVTVVATNDVGRDAISFSVKTYKVLTGVALDDVESTLYHKRLPPPKGKGSSLTLPSQTKIRHYHQPLSEDDWINWHKQMEERSRMRSVDDIIDKLDTSSADRGRDGSQSPTVTSSTAHQQSADSGDENDTVRPRHASCPADDVPPTSVDVRGAFAPSTDDRLHVDRLRSTRERAASPNTEPLWTMFGTPLGQLCRRLLVDSTTTAHEQRRAVSESQSTEPRSTDIAAGKAECRPTTSISKNLRQSIEVQPPQASVAVQPSIAAGRLGAVRSNGHKPPIPTKPSLPPKPPIAKKPSFSREASAAVTRTPSSVSSPAVVDQRLTSSDKSADSRVDGALSTSTSAPTSPLVRVTGRGASHQQQVVAGSAVTATRARGAADHTPPTNAADKTKPATTTGDVGERRPSSPVRDHRMKTTKSEEFLARIHRRSVSPVGTPRHVARSARGTSVDLSAASDTPSTTVGRRTLSKEWAVLTTTTHEEVTVISRPPATTTSTVHVDSPSVTSSTVGLVRGTVDNDGVDSSAGRLYKTAIDNIRLSVGARASSARPTGHGGGDGDGASRQLRGVPRPGSEARTAGGRESTTGASRQLDDLISSLIEIAVDVEDAQSLQPSSVRHGVLSTVRY